MSVYRVYKISNCLWRLFQSAKIQSFKLNVHRFHMYYETNVINNPPPSKLLADNTEARKEVTPSVRLNMHINYSAIKIFIIA